MTRQKWTTDEQHAWLVERMPGFVEANQTKKAAKQFFPAVVRDFCEKWPAPPCTPAEIDDAKSKEMAARVKRDQYEKRITFWFHNNARSLAGAAPSRAVLKVTPKSNPKKMQPWQAYQVLTYEPKWKPVIDKEWIDYKRKWEIEHPGEPVPKGRRLVFMMAFFKEKFAHESEAVKQAVEDFRQLRALSPEPVDPDEKKNQEFAIAINKLPRTLSTIGESLMAQTGWNITIIAGGPSPNENGSLMTFLSHTGKSKEGETFEKYLGSKEYEEHLLKPFNKFLYASFSSEDSATRSLTKIETKEATSVSQSGPGGQDEDSDNLPAESEDEGTDEIEAGCSTQKISDYELRRAKNIAELQLTVEALKNQFTLPGELQSKSAQQKKGSKKEKGGGVDENVTIARRESSRNKPNQSTTATTVNNTPDLSVADSNSANSNSADSNNAAPVASPNPTINTTPVPTAAAPSTPSRASEKVSPAAAIIQNVISNSPSTRALVAINPNTFHLTREKDSGCANSGDESNPPTSTVNSLLYADTNSSALTSTSGAVKADVPPESPVTPGSANDGQPDKADDVVMEDISILLTQEPHPPTITPPAQEQLNTDAIPAREQKSTEGLPTWLCDMLDYLRGVSNNASWQCMVDSLTDFERMGFPNGNLPTKSRPQEVSNWIKSKKKRDIPTLNAAEFGARFTDWWEAMQPTWRKGSGRSLVREIPEGLEGDTWGVLRKKGTAGIYVVVMGLSWWIHAQRSEHSADAWAAVKDLEWVLQQMMATDKTPEMASTPKRVREDDDLVVQPAKSSRRRH